MNAIDLQGAKESNCLCRSCARYVNHTLIKKSERLPIVQECLDCYGDCENCIAYRYKESKKSCPYFILVKTVEEDEPERIDYR